MNDVSTLDEVPSHRRWALALQRAHFRYPHLTREEYATLMSEAGWREQHRQWAELDAELARIGGTP